MIKTFSAFTTTKGEAAAYRLAQAIEHLTPAPMGVVVSELEEHSTDWQIGGYFAAPPDTIALSLLARACKANDFVVSELADRDWIETVHRSLKPVREGRFFIYGSHDADQIPQDSAIIPLHINASMAFGTGYHATTRGCLQALQAAHEKGMWGVGHAPRTIADVGCGTGILTMAAAHLWTDSRIYSGDSDAVAIEVAKYNLSINQIPNGKARIVYHHAIGLQATPLLAGAPFDMIIVNILTKVVLALIEDVRTALQPHGVVILSGIANQHANDVAHAYAQRGIQTIDKYPNGNWPTLLCQSIP